MQYLSIFHAEGWNIYNIYIYIYIYEAIIFIELENGDQHYKFSQPIQFLIILSLKGIHSKYGCESIIQRLLCRITVSIFDVGCLLKFIKAIVVTHFLNVCATESLHFSFSSVVMLFEI